MELAVNVADSGTANPNLELQIKDRTDHLRTVCGAAKQRLTCTCTKVTWRIIRVGISLWQIADMVSDGFQTRKYFNLAIVSRMKQQISPVMQSGFDSLPI